MTTRFVACIFCPHILCVVVPPAGICSSEQFPAEWGENLKVREAKQTNEFDESRASIISLKNLP